MNMPGNWENRKQRRVELNESLLMLTNLEETLGDFRDEFPHISLKHFLVVFETKQPGANNWEERYMEIRPLDYFMRLALPGFVYLVIVRDAYNYLSDPERKKLIHHWFCRIPRNYLDNASFIPYDTPAGFFSNIQRFNVSEKPLNSASMFGRGKQWQK